MSVAEIIDSVETFRSVPLRGLGSRVDREANIIRGYAVATAGVVKDRRLEFDEPALKKIVELGNASPQGIKSRFTHPGMSQDGLGKYLGRSKNFRLEEGVVRADLHLSPRAFDTPHGDLGSYVLDLAETEPEAFGASLVMPWKPRRRYNADGTPMLGEDGEEVPPFAEVLAVKASDIVDEPAANNGFFGDLSSPDWPARQATLVLDSLFSDAPAAEVRARVEAFVNRYLTDRGDEPVMSTPNQTTGGTVVNVTSLSPAPVPAAQLSTEPVAAEADLAAAREEARVAERSRAKEIRALCGAAGFADKADAYVEGDLSVADVREALFSEMCKRNATMPAEGSAGGPKPKDPDAELKADFAKFPDVARKLGVSEESYCLAAKILAGDEPLIISG